MDFKFHNKRISGILSVLPKRRVKFEDEIGNYGFSLEKMKNLKEVIGFDERRIVEGDECASDLVQYGINHLFDNGLLRREDVGALIFVTQTPDHFMPPTSCILHGKLGLPKDVVCFDINQGCTGYLYGLLQAFMVLDVFTSKKVLVTVGDTLSRRACPQDRNIYPIIGDAAAVTVVENSHGQKESRMELLTDGTRSNWLIIPAGGFRKPSTEETRQIRDLPDGNRRSDDDFYMNGAGIFTFSLTDVPDSLSVFMNSSTNITNKIDFFIFHQPNRFILGKLAKKLGLPMEKVPMNIVEKYGNPGVASIPVTICDNLGKRLLTEKLTLLMSGFGVGLAWGNLIMEIGPLDFCELIDK